VAGTKPTSAPELGGLTEVQGRAWSAFLRAHARTVRAMSEDLEAGGGLQLTHYDVLRQLALAPGERLRMADLADRVMLSRPGLTGVVGRLESQGMIERERVSDDGRGLYAVLTAAGRRCLVTAHSTHVASIRRRFADRYTADELRVLAELLGRLSEPAEPPRTSPRSPTR
jgi:DNA-binding MarR family transcriptional regulator